MSDTSQDLPVDKLRQLCLTRWGKSSPTTSADWSGSQASPFFQRLPPELRQQIYCEILGDQEVHIDLFWGRHVGRRIHRACFQADLDVSYPKEWYWWQSTCHRALNRHFADDSCHHPGYNACWCFGNQDSCGLGIYGWLVSCRQALKEGVDFILSPTTLHIQSTATLIFLPQLSLSHPLATVREVRLSLIDKDVLQGNTQEELTIAPGWPIYRATLAAVPRAFPRLRGLFINIASYINGWANYSESNPGPFPGHVRFADRQLVKGGLLEPIDSLHRALLGSLRDLKVVFSDDVFDVLAEDENVIGTGITQDDDQLVLMDLSKWDKFWRSSIEGEVLGYWVFRQPSYVWHDSDIDD